MFLASDFPSSSWRRSSPFSKRTTVESTRYYYYSEDKIFEKSLDVYKPVFTNTVSAKNDDTDTDTDTDTDLPIVILVVGSGWVGHRSFVYAGTSWWNSSGPKAVASLGQTCVCIRHRGAFCVLPSASVLAQWLVLLFGVLFAFTYWEIALGITAVVALALGLLALGGRGSASFDDMLEDVAQALKWIDDNPELVRITTSNAKEATQDETPMRAQLSTDSSSASYLDDTEGDNDNNHDTPLSSPTATPSRQRFNNSDSANHDQRGRVPMVFGGYSSGGHVAATLLQEPELFTKYGLPHPEQLFDAILMISGVFAVRPERISLPVENDKKTITSTSIAAVNGPTWLVEFVMNLVWGPDIAPKIPSPLALDQPPRLPHLLVGCRNEMFGLSWLDIFFCSQLYTAKIKALTQQHTKYVPVESDHWNILNSQALRDALQRELPNLIVRPTGQQ